MVASGTQPQKEIFDGISLLTAATNTPFPRPPLLPGLGGSFRVWFSRQDVGMEGRQANQHADISKVPHAYSINVINLIWSLMFYIFIVLKMVGIGDEKLK